MYSKNQKFEMLAWEESEGQHEKEVWEEVYLPERATSSLPGGNQQRRMLIGSPAGTRLCTFYPFVRK